MALNSPHLALILLVSYSLTISPNAVVLHVWHCLTVGIKPPFPFIFDSFSANVASLMLSEFFFSSPNVTNTLTE